MSSDLQFLIGLAILAIGIGGCSMMEKKGNADMLRAKAEARVIESQVEKWSEWKCTATNVASIKE